MSSRTRFRQQRGATLIEVLIAVLVLSIGLLGALKLQTEGVKMNANSRYTVIATTLAHDALDAIYFDRSNSATAWTGVTTASTAAGASGRLGDWLTRLQAELPDGKASIACANNACTVQIFWSPPGQDEVSATYSMYN